MVASENLRHPELRDLRDTLSQPPILFEGVWRAKWFALGVTEPDLEEHRTTGS